MIVVTYGDGGSIRYTVEPGGAPVQGKIVKEMERSRMLRARDAGLLGVAQSYCLTDPWR